MSQDPILAELVRRVTNLEDDLMRQTARISVPVSGAFFSAYASGTTALSAGVTTKINLAGVNYTDGNWNTSTYTYVCPVAGNYLFCGNIWGTATAAGNCFSQIFQNGSAVARGPEVYIAAGGFISSPVSKVIRCAIGDSIILQGYAGGAGTISAIADGTFLTGQIQ